MRDKTAISREKHAAAPLVPQDAPDRCAEPLENVVRRPAPLPAAAPVSLLTSESKDFPGFSPAAREYAHRFPPFYPANGARLLNCRPRLRFRRRARALAARHVPHP